MRDQRQDQIVKMILENRMVKASDLIKKFHVSMETIRRDLEQLEKEGKLTRVFGGAVAKSMQGVEPSYTFREIKNYEKKLAIGRTAAQLVEDGDTLIVDLGTTTLEFVKFLRDKKDLTVFTNCIQHAVELSKNPNIKIIMLGGTVRAGELSTSGFLAEESIDRFHVDKVFLGVGGFTLPFGIGDYNVEESNLRRHYISHAQKVIALADYSKFGVSTLSQVCAVDKIDILVTDEETDKKMVAQLRRSGVEVIVAENKTE